MKERIDELFKNKKKKQKWFLVINKVDLNNKAVKEIKTNLSNKDHYSKIFSYSDRNERESIKFYKEEIEIKNAIYNSIKNKMANTKKFDMKISGSDKGILVPNFKNIFLMVKNLLYQTKQPKMIP